MTNRYNQQTNFVPAVRSSQLDAQVVTRLAQTAMQPVTQSEVDSLALRAMETVSERSTPVDRALGIVIKGALIVLVALFATYALGRAGATGTQAAIFFIVLVLGGVAVLYWLDYSHSPIGSERYKASQYVKLEKHRIDAVKEVELAKVDAFENMVRMTYGPTGIETDER